MSSWDREEGRRGYGVAFAALLALVVLAGLVVWVKTPPGVARLLPECDAVVYARLGPVRAATHFDRTPVRRSAEFQGFIDATGIVPERDLDAAAFALHRMANPAGPNGAVGYSEVFEGRFDGERLGRYLEGIAESKESYAGHTLYTIAVGEQAGPGGRRLRVTLLDGHRIAASNLPTTEQIHAMLDRERGWGTLFGGPTVLTGLYPEVPVLSSAWGVGTLGLPLAEGGAVSVMGLRLPVREETVFVASVRFLGALHLRVEEMAGSEAEAGRTAGELRPVLALFGAVMGRQGAEKPARRVFDSIKIGLEKDRMLVTATVPYDVLRTLMANGGQAPR